MHKFSANSFVYTILAASLIFCIPTPSRRVFESDECQAEKAAIICLLLCANTFFQLLKSINKLCFAFLCFLPPVKNHANWTGDKVYSAFGANKILGVCYGNFCILFMTFDNVNLTRLQKQMEN